VQPVSAIKDAAQAALRVIGRRFATGACLVIKAIWVASLQPASLWED
jgi:hypothetical protein